MNVRKILYSFIFLMIVAGCKQEISVDEALSNYANKYNGHWSQDGLLSVGVVNEDIDLRGLVKLPQKALNEVKSLEIHGNITFLPELSTLHNLKDLWLGNGMRDLAAISNNKALEKLSISGNPVSSIDCIGSLVNLKIFNGDDTHISDIEILNRMPELTTVNLHGSKLARFPDLSSTKIQTIIISKTPIESLKNLETLKMPFRLWINGCYNLKDIT